MPLELPNLDNRTYDDLVQEALGMIPTLAPDWTNHNPSDPGITLIELFAYLTELLIYRLNRVTDDNILTFLALLNGPVWKPTQALPEEVRQTVLHLRSRYRAVTRDDYQQLSTTDFNGWLRQMQTAEQAADGEKLAEWWQLTGFDPHPPAPEDSSTPPTPHFPSQLPPIQRAHCVVEHNLDMHQEVDRQQPAPGHVSVVILPAHGTINPQELGPQPSENQRRVLHNYLDGRRILTTRLHVVGPTYTPVSASIIVARYADVLDDVLRRQIIRAINGFLSPLPIQTIPNHTGWPFGRDVFNSELYELLEKLDGVDYIPDIELTSQCDPRHHPYVAAESMWNKDGDQVGLKLYNHHLPVPQFRRLSLPLIWQVELNRGPTVSEALRQEFDQNGVSLGAIATISTLEKDAWWSIQDRGTAGEPTYLISREQNRLDVYDPAEINKIAIVSNQQMRVIPITMTLTPTPTAKSDLKQQLKTQIRAFLEFLRPRSDITQPTFMQISQGVDSNNRLQIHLTPQRRIATRFDPDLNFVVSRFSPSDIEGVQSVNAIDLPTTTINLKEELADLRLHIRLEGE
jgi:hypothetical protein